MPHAVQRAPHGGGRGNQGRGRGGRGGRGGGGGGGRNTNKGSLASRGQQTKEAAEAKAKQEEKARHKADLLASLDKLKDSFDNRLNQLERHLQLNCFNYLDEQSRKNIFMVMEWPMDNYMMRKEQMRVSVLFILYDTIEYMMCTSYAHIFILL